MKIESACWMIDRSTPLWFLQRSTAILKGFQFYELSVVCSPPKSNLRKIESYLLLLYKLCCKQQQYRLFIPVQCHITNMSLETQDKKEFRHSTCMCFPSPWKPFKIACWEFLSRKHFIVLTWQMIHFLDKLMFEKCFLYIYILFLISAKFF